MAKRNSPVATDEQGQLINVETGEVIKPGDPLWQPEYSQVLAQQAPEGKHWVYPNGFDPTQPNGGGQLQSNDVPWYADPALLGAIGTAAVGGILGAVGTGADAAGAGAAGSSVDALPGALSATDVAAEGGIVPGTAAGDIVGGLTGGGATSSGLLGKVGGLVSAAGSGIGAATNASMNNALAQEKLGLDANQENITGEQAFINEQLAMAKEEDAQRKAAMGDVYRANAVANPRVSPFDPVGAPKFTTQYIDTANNLGSQGSSLLQNAAKYNVAGMPAPKPYTPISISDVQGATNTAPGLLTKIGNVAGPVATIAGKLLPLIG